VGFRDPESEGDSDPDEILVKLARAAAENFFPALVQGRLTVTVEHVVDGEQRRRVEVNAREYVPELCDALERYHAGEVVDELHEAGDVARRIIRLRVPATRAGAEGVTAYTEELEAPCVLVIRLAEETEGEHALVPPNRVALVRGRGMVTQFISHENIAVGARPFHAIFLGGEAAGTETALLAAEQFLRLSEPPAHNAWVFNDELRGKYHRGAKRVLSDLRSAITEALREVVKPNVVAEEDGPEELRRLLNLGTGIVSPPPLATLRNIRATLVDGAWQIEADVSVNERRKRLRVTPRAWIDVESGAAVRLPWATFEHREGRETFSSDGSFVIGPQPRAVSFRGRTDSEAEGILAALCRAKLDVSVDSLPDGPRS
jgi:RNA polymerase primary sigma factor